MEHGSAHAVALPHARGRRGGPHSGAARRGADGRRSQERGDGVSAADFKGLRALAEVAGRRFRRGIVLYTGAEIVPFGAGLFALPAEALWRWSGQTAAGKKARR